MCSVERVPRRVVPSSVDRCNRLIESPARLTRRVCRRLERVRRAARPPKADVVVFVGFLRLQAPLRSTRAVYEQSERRNRRRRRAVAISAVASPGMETVADAGSLLVFGRTGAVPSRSDASRG